LGDVISIQDYKMKKENKEREEELKIAEQEYNEFIKLLKYFVDIQEPKYEEIHITQNSDGTYKLIDEAGNEVHREYFDEFKREIEDSEVNYDDLLISSLITMSPKKIIINNSESIKNKELLMTISKVFDNTELRK
jgi:putative sporulation protein YtxC